ncbi:hypothetical protein [Oleiagrimonas soli]|uniref:Transmembrane protein n=1 Tax=Oleiagrimonas soli TaxID=1543381 RepID=A0A099CXT0_9GAMM|nr:hypothetical protein [Oleiagrimonas soli]KGI77855.1 hypothetical protein LF63_0105425 [Oleiagrimonas soli]MBB6183801.1 hypothetical protein [Oleiagrimonas soli]
MSSTLVKSIACAAAVAAMVVAPSAFAGHGRHGGYHYRGGYYGHAVRYHGGYGHHYYHRDHFGRWVAGAVVVGALTSLVVNATQPRVVYYDNPPVVYSRTRVIYRDVPVERVYESRTVYSDPYQTRYIGRDDSYDDDN